MFSNRCDFLSIPKREFSLGARECRSVEMDANEFVSQNAKAPIFEIVDPKYTVLVKIPKSRLPARRP